MSPLQQSSASPLRLKNGSLRLSISAAFAPVVLSLSTLAQGSEVFFDEIPIVLTASRLEQSALDAPAAVTVIDRHMIEASGATELHDLLRFVPGFLVGDTPDGPPMVANHGLGDALDRRVKVMIDGRTVNSPIWGDTRWTNLPIRVDDLERIEVVRGPNGAAFGVNAFQGVINLITRMPGSEKGTRLITRAGLDGFFDVGVRLNQRTESQIDWRLTASRRAAVNFKPHFEEGMGWHSKEAVAHNVFNFDASTWLTSQDELRLLVGGSDSDSRMGKETDLMFPPHKQYERAYYLALEWAHTFDPESQLSVQYQLQRERMRSGYELIYDLGNNQFYPLQVNHDRDAQRHDLEMQFSKRLNNNWRMMLGAGVRNETAKSERFFSGKGTVGGTSRQIFGSLTWQPNAKIAVDAGGTYEWHHYSDSLFSPRLAVNYALSPEQSLRAATGVSYRAPSLMESHAFEAIRVGDDIRSIQYWASNRIDPERVRYIDLGYVAHLREYGVKFDARVFREYYNGYIDDNSCINPPNLGTFKNRPPCADAPANFKPVVPEQKSFIFENNGPFVMDGAEFSIDWSKPGVARAVLSQAFINIKPRREALRDRDIELSAPHSMTSLLLSFDLPQRWRASMAYYHTGEMYWLNGGDRVGPRDRFDFKLARSFGALGSDNEIALTVQSAAGRYPEYHEGKYRHEPRAFVTLALNW